MFVVAVVVVCVLKPLTHNMPTCVGGTSRVYFNGCLFSGFWVVTQIKAGCLHDACCANAKAAEDQGLNQKLCKMSQESMVGRGCNSQVSLWGLGRKKKTQDFEAQTECGEEREGE